MQGCKGLSVQWLGGSGARHLQVSKMQGLESLRGLLGPGSSRVQGFKGLKAWAVRSRGIQGPSVCEGSRLEGARCRGLEGSRSQEFQGSRGSSLRGFVALPIMTTSPEAEYSADCDVSKYFMGTPYSQTEIKDTLNFADMVSKCRSQYMDAGGFGGWSQRYTNGNGLCARFTREPTQSEWDSAESSNCAAYPGPSGHCGAVCGTSFNYQAPAPLTSPSYDCSHSMNSFHIGD